MTIEVLEILRILDEILGNVDENRNIHPSTRREFGNTIRDTGEKAFQRAILSSKLSILDDNQIIEWYDIELPVVFSRNSRRPCIDLIGREKQDLNRFTLCELKLNKIKNSPLYAIKELLGYYRGIINNASHLNNYSIHHSNLMCTQFDREWFLENKPLLVVVANNIYWNNWRGVLFNNQKNEIQNLSKRIGVDIKLYETPNFDFKSQRNDQPSYWPKLDTNEPWIRIN